MLRAVHVHTNTRYADFQGWSGFKDGAVERHQKFTAGEEIGIRWDFTFQRGANEGLVAGNINTQRLINMELPHVLLERAII